MPPPLKEAAVPETPSVSTAAARPRRLRIKLPKLSLPRIKLPKFSFPRVSLPTVPLRTRLTLAGVLALLSIAAAGALFYGELAGSLAGVATRVREMSVPRSATPAQESVAEPQEEPHIAPSYASFKFILPGRDQKLISVSPSGERTVTVSSVQLAIPELPAAYALMPLTPVSAGGPAFFGARVPHTDGGTWSGFYTFVPATQSFSRLTALDVHPPAWGEEPTFSPDGRRVASGVDTEGGKNLYIIDLASDTATRVDTLPEGETFVSGSSRGTPEADIRWVDDTTLALGIYAEGTEPPQLIRREEVTITQPAPSGDGDSRYEVTPSYRELRESSSLPDGDQALVALSTEGFPVTLVPSVWEALPELEGSALLELDSSRATTEGMLDFRVRCIADCGSLTGYRYTLELATGVFSRHEMATEADFGDS